jgi:hypothetical protein
MNSAKSVQRRRLLGHHDTACSDDNGESAF